MRTRRSLPRIILCLLAGALINAALAQAAGWWCRFGIAELRSERTTTFISVGPNVARIRSTSTWGKQLVTWHLLTPESAESWQHYDAYPESEFVSKTVPNCHPSASVPGWSRVWDEDLWSRVTARAPNELSTALDDPEQVDIAIGWPFLCFSMYSPNGLWREPFEQETQDSGYIGPGAVGTCIAHRVLAWHPIFPGILFGSVAWALAVWLPLAFFESGQRAWRRRRGRCEGCGYDRRGLSGAPSAVGELAWILVPRWRAPLSPVEPSISSFDDIPAHLPSLPARLDFSPNFPLRRKPGRGHKSNRQHYRSARPLPG